MTKINKPKAHWYDERDSNDAAVWYNAEEASAWAAGYNAAVQANVDELNATLKEQNRLMGLE